MKRFMRKFRKQFRYGEKGFTLIELIVVVAILGILAAIIVPNLAKFIGTGTEEACKIEDRMMKTATMAYAADEEKCPTTAGYTTELADYFEDISDLLAAYTFSGTWPACTVTQGTCPTP